MVQIGSYNIKPISIYLPEVTEEDEENYARNWPERCNQANEYFKSQGLDVFWTYGIHAAKFGIKPARPYLRDNPEQNWHVAQRTMGGYLSGYQILNVAYSHPEWETILILEDDCRFIDGWKERLEQALLDVPADFDFLFLGACCTEGRPTEHIKGDVYEVKYPLCGHANIIAKKAIPTLLNRMRDCCVNFDIHLFDEGFKDLKVYTILPRLANQPGTEIPI